MNTASELVLFEQVKAGNEQAFNTLFEQFYQRLCDFANLHYVKDSAVAEEIVADVFANIWLKRKQISIEYNLRSYLYTSTKNTALAYLRKKRLPQDSIDALEDFQFLPGDDCPHDRLMENESAARVNAILSVIPEKSRQVFVMHRFDGLRHKEIAEILQISTKTVENHVGKALKLLRDAFGDKKDALLLFVAAWFGRKSH